MPNVISMISFRGTLSKLSLTNPLTRGFTPGPHWVLRPQTHSHYGAWGKRREGKRGEGVSECPNLELLSSLAFVQKFKFILMKMHKNCCHRAAPFGSDMHQIVCRLVPNPTGGAYSAPPDPIADLGVGPRGKGRREGRGRQGRESRNARIQSWQAYSCGDSVGVGSFHTVDSSTTALVIFSFKWKSTLLNVLF